MPTTVHITDQGNQTISGVKTFATGIFAPNLVYNTGDQTISGVKTFANNIQVSGTGVFNAIDLNNIDNLSLSGVDITITSGAVTLTNPVSAPNLVYNIGNQTISGVKTFISSGIFSLSGAAPFGLLNNPLTVVGSGNSYLQLNIQNRASGTNATADLVITANNGTDSANFINLGINNSGYNDPTFSNGSGLDGYLFVNGGSLDIGTATPNTQIEFHVGGTTAARSIATINSSGLNIVSGNLTVNNTGVLLSGQNVFVLQGGTTQSTTSIGDNYIGLAGAHIGYSSTSASRRVAILENCVARKASIILHQDATGPSVSNITGSLINVTQGLTGIISQSMTATNNNNFTNYSNSNLNVPFSAGDNAIVLIHSQSAIVNVRVMANVYFYN